MRLRRKLVIPFSQLPNTASTPKSGFLSAVGLSLSSFSRQPEKRLDGKQRKS
jgi:hypothetical protein